MSNLKQIRIRADQSLKAIDDFWEYAKKKGWFENKELMNSVMFMEHEVSRAATMTKVHVTDLEERLNKIGEGLNSAMGSQQYDVLVNGANHPGLLESMAGILKRLNDNFQDVLEK